MAKITQDQIADRYNISTRSVRNWEDAGRDAGSSPPWQSPANMEAWYEAVFDRALPQRVADQIDLIEQKAAAQRDDLVDKMGGSETGAAHHADNGKRVDLESWPISELIRATLEAMEVKSAYADVLEMGRNAKQAMEAAQARKNPAEELKQKKLWIECAKEARQLSKTPEVIALAKHLLQRWIDEDLTAKLAELKRLLLSDEFLDQLGFGDLDFEGARDKREVIEELLAGWQLEFYGGPSDD